MTQDEATKRKNEHTASGSRRDFVFIGLWLILALAAGVTMGAVAAPVHVQSKNGVAAGSTYSLTLVITADNAWNSTTSAPKYWVLTPQGLASAANITLPAHTLIRLTIVDYDTPSPLPAQYGQVTGTVGNVVYLVNGTAASSSNISLSGEKLSFINPNTQVAHTFTVPQLGINIPSMGGSTEVAEFTLNQTGVFTWHCMDPCGFGPSGWAGPMSAPGWMSGTLTVVNP